MKKIKLNNADIVSVGTAKGVFLYDSVSLAKSLGVNHLTVKNWRNNGIRGVKLNCITLDNRYVYRKSDYLAFAESVRNANKQKIGPKPKHDWNNPLALSNPPSLIIPSKSIKEDENGKFIEIMTINDLVVMMNTTKSFIEKLINDQGLPHYKVGRWIKIFLSPETEINYKKMTKDPYQEYITEYKNNDISPYRLAKKYGIEYNSLLRKLKKEGIYRGAP